MKKDIANNLSLMFDKLHTNLRKERQEAKESSQLQLNSSLSPKELYPVKKTVFQMFQDAINNTSFDNQEDNGINITGTV